MTYLLHIDTSSATGTVLLAAGEQPLAVRVSDTERDHAGSINRMIEAVLEEGGIGLEELQAIAVCSGPGSYTGLRIGMATAKGLGYALDKPLLLISRLELLAAREQPAPGQAVFALLPARPGEYFMAGYQDGASICGPMHSTADTINNYLSNYRNIVISGIVQEDIHTANTHYYNKGDDVSAALRAACSMRHWEAGMTTEVAAAHPLYLKEVFVHKKV